MKKRVIFIFIASAIVFVGAICALFAQFPRPRYAAIEKSGLAPSLVYAVIKAESNFDEGAKSGAGAVGLMQILPSTAQFVCERENIDYDEARLLEGEYNVLVGCVYLKYLKEKFFDETAVLAAYNAGEGTVDKWLKERTLSHDGVHLNRIPYGETRAYVKKIKKFLKFYQFVGDKT